MLEDRSLMSATGVTVEFRDVPTAIFAPGYREVIITGTEGSDQIRVALDKMTQGRGEIEVINIWADGNMIAQNVFPSRKGYDRITIKGMGGNDDIRVNYGINIDTFITTGDGNDTIFGGGGRDAINSGGGDDVVFGRGGDDSIYTGPQGVWDREFGYITTYKGPDNDTVWGGGGSDVIDGGVGNDALHGDSSGISYPDSFHSDRESPDDSGNAGTDSLYGGWGRDTFDGGEYVSDLDWINQAPQVMGSSAIVQSKTVDLAVRASDDFGEGALKYTWEVTSTPDGAASPTFSVNATNAARNTTATFSQAGRYTFKITVTDQGGLTASRSIDVEVVQTASKIEIEKGPEGVVTGGTLQFRANAVDQFGNAAPVTWEVTGGGTIDKNTGRFSAPNTSGRSTVTARSGSVSATANIVTTSAPTVQKVASASQSTVTGTTVNLTVLGTDDAGEQNLTYTWRSDGPASVSFSANGTNASKNVTATFQRAGNYTFYVTITDKYGLSATSQVGVVVNPTLSGIKLTSSSSSAALGGTLQLSATLQDQFGKEVSQKPAYTWTVTGGGSISPTGLFTAPKTPGTVTVTVIGGGFSATLNINVVNTPPSIVTPAAAQLSADQKEATLSVQGNDDGGAGNLTYSWKVTAAPSGASAPSFSSAGAQTTVKFQQAGSYTFQVTITDKQGLTAVSSVTVEVKQIVSKIEIASGPETLLPGATRQFSAVAVDQFGQAVQIRWSVSGGGSITQSGLFTAPTKNATSTVTASFGSISATATVKTVIPPPTIPTNVRAAKSGSSVKLTWSDTLYENGYTVQIKRADGKWTDYQVGAGTVSFTANNLKKGFLYYFRVIAHNDAGTSLPSSSVSVKM